MHACATLTLIIWISCISKSIEQPPGKTVDFVSASLKTYREVSNALRIWNCFDQAMDKANKVGHASTDGVRHAIAWMSMYSRLCLIDESRLNQDRGINNFPFRLNKELRCSFHPQRNELIKNIFLEAGSMIDRAMEELHPEVYADSLFRGAKDFPYSNKDFVDEGFFSASRDINVALHFAEGNILMIVERMRGLYIANYAQDRFRHQQEVLGKRKSMFRVRRRETKPDLIRQIIGSFKRRITRPYPKEIIYLYQVTPSIEVVDRISRAQQGQSFVYCTP